MDGWRDESFYDFNWVYTDLSVIKAIADDGIRLVTTVRNLTEFLNKSRPGLDMFGSEDLTLNDMGSVAVAARSNPDQLLVTDFLDRCDFHLTLKIQCNIKVDSVAQR